jgi:hypothetical protein
MSKNGIEKEIDYLRDAKTHLWIAGLSSFGGSISFLAFNIPLFFKITGFLTGFIFSVGFFDNYFKKGDMIEKRINFLKDKGE